jgi:hypothetical protein
MFGVGKELHDESACRLNVERIIHVALTLMSDEFRNASHPGGHRGKTPDHRL